MECGRKRSVVMNFSRYLNGRFVRKLLFEGLLGIERGDASRLIAMEIAQDGFLDKVLRGRTGMEQLLGDTR